MPEERAAVRVARALALLCVVGLACLAARAEVVEIRHAQARIEVEGQVMQRDVRLPFHMDRELGTRPARAEFRATFDTPGGATPLWGMYLPRVGNRARLFLNGFLLAELGDPDAANSDDYEKAPRYFALPAGLLEPRNELRVVVAADGARRGGLSSVFVGPDAELGQMFERASWWRMTASTFVAVFSLLVGSIALLLWLTQLDVEGPGSRRDSIYLSAAAAELCWALRVGDVGIEHPPLPWPYWGVVITAAFAGWICCIALFCHHAAGWHRHRTMPAARAFLCALFATSVLASWTSYTTFQPVYLTAWLGAANLFFIGYAVFYLAAAVRSADRTRLLVGLVGAANVAMGVRDWIAIRVSGDYAQSTWIRYSSILFGIALVSIVVGRFRRASAQAHELAGGLAQRVAERERELAQSYAQLERMARNQERSAERTRILRDMHDGVGSHLSAAIRQLQSGRAEPEMVLQTLRDALEQLKLSIDAMNLPPGDINALLAGMRYRLQPRFAASDLELHWNVEELQAIERLDSAGMRQLQFILFEALSNVLQHAGARTLRIEATDGEGEVHLRIVDDGKGFDVAREARSGVETMRERAAAIGAAFAVDSSPGRTAVDLRIQA